MDEFISLRLRGVNCIIVLIVYRCVPVYLWAILRVVNIIKEGDSMYFSLDHRTNMEGIAHKWIEVRVRVSEVVLRFQKKGLVNYGQNILGF